MPGPLTPELLQRFADPAYLSREAPAQPRTGPNWMHRLGLPVFIGGQGLDTATTLIDTPGTEEVNPIFGAHPSAAKVLALKVGLLAPLGYLLDHSYDKAEPGSGTRKAALLTALGVGAAGALAGGHNLRLAMTKKF